VAPEVVAEKQAPKAVDPGPKATYTRQKDPKKVAAGRAGAASRKAKQERLEEELRKATELQVGTSGAPASAYVAPQASPPSDVPAPTPHAVGSTFPWVIGVAAFLGVAYWAASRRAPVNLPAPPPATPPPAQPATPPPAQQLKVAHNPFYME